jgi:hypothetical protein
MNRWKGIRAAVLVAVLALALTPLTADACVNSWEMKATPGDGQVTLEWGELPAGHSAKIVRSIYGWPGDPTFADDPNVSNCWANEPDVVVYRGTERSVVDTGVINGRTYWYTLFVRDDATGEYLYDKSEVVATPGPVDVMSTPKVGVSSVHEDAKFKVYAGISNKHTVDTRMQVILQKKVSGKWTWVRSSTVTLREGNTWIATYTLAPTTGYYRVVFKHVGVGETPVLSPYRYFTSYR